VEGCRDVSIPIECPYIPDRLDCRFDRVRHERAPVPADAQLKDYAVLVPLQPHSIVSKIDGKLTSFPSAGTPVHIRTNLATEWRFKLATDSHPNLATRKLMAQPRPAAMRQEPAIYNARNFGAGRRQHPH